MEDDITDYQPDITRWRMQKIANEQKPPQPEVKFVQPEYCA